MDQRSLVISPAPATGQQHPNFVDVFSIFLDRPQPLQVTNNAVGRLWGDALGENRPRFTFDPAVAGETSNLLVDFLPSTLNPCR